MKSIFRIFVFLFFVNNCFSQNYYNLKGFVISDSTNEQISMANVFVKETKQNFITDSNGVFNLRTSQNIISLNIKDINHKELNEKIVLSSDTIIIFKMKSLSISLKEVSIVSDIQWKTQTTLNDVEKFSINAGRKNEVINLTEISANKSLNVSRQIYARVSGVNIVENDAAGIQLGIGTRGLNPNRITEFNARQNGYDIAADAFGYPESYYTPPADFIERIEVIRGAASLQYGPQFGGLLNFKLIQPVEKKIFFSNKITKGSFGFFSNNTIISSTYSKFSYLMAFNYKEAGGWRSNSGYKNLNGYALFNWKINSKLQNSLQYTHMTYLMQQPGGLTDLQFLENPQQSFRERNWFDAEWNILANETSYEIRENLKLNSKLFYMFSHRYSVGNLASPNVVDNKLDRDLQKDNYNNVGLEIKFIKSYQLLKMESTLLSGIRFYKGKTLRNQGFTDALSTPSFNFNNPEALEGSSFDFISINSSFFAENIFQVSNKLKLTPGVRVENLITNADGYYTINNNQTKENNSNKRYFPLFGITLSQKFSKYIELYGGVAQSYNAVNFNDIRVINKNIVVDSNLKDVSGYNSELGARGNFNNLFFYDFNLFYLKYNNRIGLESKVNSEFNTYQFRTNIADSRSYGFETMIELDLFKLFKNTNSFGKLLFYQTFSYTKASYIDTKDVFVLNNSVEYAPNYIYRSGLEYKHKNIKSSLQFSYTSNQYTDAGNSISSINGVNGIIPAYSLIDYTIGYNMKRWALSFSCNNLLNQTYFTRRATGYPGPGILPSDPRSFYISMEVKF